MSEAKRTSARANPVGKGVGKPKQHKQGANKPGKKPPPKTNPSGQALEAAAKKFVNIGGTKLLLKAFPYLLFGYLGDKMSYAYRVTDAPDFFSKLVWSLGNLGTTFGEIMPSFHPADLLFGAASGAGMWIAVYLKGRNAKKFRKGVEYGSAR